MARRGTPLPFAMRTLARELRAAGATVRAIAAELGLSKNTANKYCGPKFGTKP